MPASLLRVLTCGSVADGKSTFIGRLLFDCGSIPAEVLVARERAARRSGAGAGWPARSVGSSARRRLCCSSARGVGALWFGLQRRRCVSALSSVGVPTALAAAA